MFCYVADTGRVSPTKQTKTFYEQNNIDISCNHKFFSTSANDNDKETNYWGNSFWILETIDTIIAKCTHFAPKNNGAQIFVVIYLYMAGMLGN